MVSENCSATLAALLEQKARASGCWQARQHAPGAEIVAPQTVADHVCIVTSGLVKLYYALPSGDEWTKSFIADRGVFGPVQATRSIYPFGARVIEEAAVGIVSLAWLSEALEADADLRQAFSRFQIWLLERKRAREANLLCLTAEDRYLTFLAEEAPLAARLQQQEVAAYLRITPVALSRIRRRLRQTGRLPRA